MTWRSRLLLALGLVACGGKGDDQAQAGSNPFALLVDSSYADTAALRQRVDSVIAIGNAHPDRVLLFARKSAGGALVAVKDSLSWPEEMESGFTVLYDDDGRVMLHTEVPTSESGDWYMVSEHFFDTQGRTVFHRAHVSGFGSECARVVRETVETFFNPITGARVARVETITDGDGLPISDPSTCFLRIKFAPPARRAFSDLARP